MIKKRVYLVDDDRSTRRSLHLVLVEANFEVRVFHDSLSVIREVKILEPDILILDIQIDELSGLDIFNKLASDGFSIPVIFISGQATLSEAVSGIKMGAFDFIEKPFSPEKLVHSINHCLEFNKIKSENEKLKEFALSDDFIGESKVFKNLLHEIQKIAPLNSTVLITGESGTGKELVAREIHRCSRLDKGPFIKVNCSSIPENLIESEFFGYMKGSFTGADRNKKGYFELADNGTIFLDEIGEMSLVAQAKILRVIQNQEIQKIGSENIISIKVRFLFATNRDLKKEVEHGKFREDLYYRIHVFPIRLPSLRERKSDIPLLAYFFLKQYLLSNQLPVKKISEGALQKLLKYSWPGNIRELKNVIERMAILGKQVLDESLLDYLDTLDEPDNSLCVEDTEIITLKEFKNKLEREYLVKILKKFEGNISLAAKKLAVERTYLHKKIHDFEIKKKEFIN